MKPLAPGKCLVMALLKGVIGNKDIACVRIAEKEGFAHICQRARRTSIALLEQQSNLKFLTEWREKAVGSCVELVVE